MYLLNTRTLTLKSFYTNIPEYAILSHTWDKDEVTYQDILNRDRVDSKKISWKKKRVEPRKAGWEKVEGACAQARKYDWEWIWIDSCCIDKSSSAELSENINSMYRLYENAGVCYVYLSDTSSKEDPRDPGSRFPKSKWFTRGWTLQELIAPSASVVFLDCSWKEIGTRYSLRDVISVITSVPVQLLEDGDLTKYSIAQKMSWAAFRKTTREEDRAYSLMGLFDICMPPIYGEGGDKAFMRLQQEIIKTSDDRSIFAWVAVCERNGSGEVDESKSRGLLARSPDEFKGSGRVGISTASFPNHTSSFSFNNNGLHIHFPVVPTDDIIRASLKCQVDGDKCNIVRASLNCQVDNRGNVCNIYLQKTADRHYVRYRPDQLVLRSFETPENVQEVIVKEIPPSRETRRVYNDLRTYVRLPRAAEEHFENVTCNGKSVPFRSDRFWSSAPFTVNFSCRHSNETVHISFAASEKGGGMLWMASSNSLKMGLAEGACYADRLAMELGSGGFVTATMQITGQSSLADTVREIEINHTTSSLVPTLRCPQSQFIEIPNYSLRDVFPPNQSDRGSSDNRSSRRYLSLSKEASGACRIFIYDGDRIAIGINENGEAWIHVPQDIGWGTSNKQIWESYQENGSRAQFKGNTSSMEVGYREKATVHKNNGLQFASHSLAITEEMPFDAIVEEPSIELDFLEVFHILPRPRHPLPPSYIDSQ